LIVDDDADFLDLYREELGLLGYRVETTQSSADAKTMLDQSWDVVLVDQRFHGVDEGLDLLREVAVRSPRAKAILVTAYPSPDAIRAAFEHGAYDYLEKGKLFSTLLEVKLRNAVQAARAERFAEISPAESDELIRALWVEVQAETDRNRKGKLLEDLMVAVLRTIKGFHQAQPRRKNNIEEIDILVQNGSEDPVWVKEGAYLLVECKNWSGHIGVDELRQFLYKLQHRFQRCRLGFFVSMNGFTGPFKDALLAERKHETLVVLVTGEDIGRLVAAADRSEVLKKLHMRAILELNGDA
jgi:CheY-like chemotaxis protein